MIDFSTIDFSFTAWTNGTSCFTPVIDFSILAPRGYSFGIALTYVMEVSLIFETIGLSLTTGVSLAIYFPIPVSLTIPVDFVYSGA